MRPKRRVVDESKVIEMGVEEPSDEQSPRVIRPLNEKSRLERLIRVTDLAINPFERQLERGISLPAEDQRLLNTHTNTLLKLEMAVAALDAKEQLHKESLSELAKTLQKKKMSREHIVAILGDSREVLNALGEE